MWDRGSDWVNFTSLEANMSSIVSWVFLAVTFIKVMWESSIISELVLDSDSDLSFSNLVLNVFFMISKQTLKSPECLVMRYEQMSIAFVSMNLKIFSTF